MVSNFHQFFRCTIYLGVLSLGLAPCSAQEHTTVSPDVSSFGYAVGIIVSMNGDSSFLRYLRETDQEQAILGFRDGLRGSPMISQKRVEQILLSEVKSRLKEKTQMDQLNAEKGRSFLAANSKTPGVLATKSGLQYSVIELGTGPRPSFGDYVKVQYVGTLIDGQVIDTTFDWRKPQYEEEFRTDDGLVSLPRLKAHQPQFGDPVLRVLSSESDWWTEGLELMPIGSKFKFFVPPELALGSTGDYGAIPGDAVLFYEVTLVAIVQPGDTEDE